jgi:hypothetical protein
MRKPMKVLVAEAIIVLVTAALISGTYSFILPRYFDGYRTFSVLVIGLMLAALASGYIYRSAMQSTTLWSWLLTILISGVVTFLAFSLSMLVIVNTRGS